MPDDDVVLYRFRSMEGDTPVKNDGAINILASTDDACDFGGYREILKHGANSIDMEAARALCINHDPNQIAGHIEEKTTDGRTLSVRARISPNAKLQSGMTVREAVDTGALRGVSIGYKFSRSDAVYNEETRTVTVNKWRLLEVTLTPIPADARASIRSLPDHFKSAAPAAINHERTAMSDPIKPQETPAVPVQPILNESAISEKARAAAIQETREVTEMARSVGLDGLSYIGKTKAEAQDQMIRDLAVKNQTPAPTVAVTQMHVDAVDKARDAVTGAMAWNAGFRDQAAIQDRNPLLGRGLQHIIKQYATMAGERTQSWDKNDVAWYALGHPEKIQGRAAANVTSSTFPNFVFLNAITKILAMGYDRGASSSRYKQIVSNNMVPDFKTFYIGALGTGNLTKTAEDVAFPELTKTDGTFSSTAKMWGGTLSLTLQALVNDDTGQFNRILSQAGVLLDKTIDRRTFQKLLMGTSTDEATSTWTSNTTSGGSLVYTSADLAVAARGRLGLVRAALANKVGLDGYPMGNMPRFLVVPVTREVEAQGIIGPSSPGQIGPGAQSSISSIQVIASAWLEASALTGYSTTSYYLVADPNEVTGLVLSKVQGYEGIQVDQYDAGAVAAIKYKLWSPFEVDLHNISIGGTATVAGAQQGTT